jgi:hypothetical protein
MWIKIVETTSDANSSNFTKAKLVKILNRCGVTYIVIKTFQKRIVEFTNCHASSICKQANGN